VVCVGSLVSAGAELVWGAGGVPSVTIRPPFSPTGEPVVYDWAPREVVEQLHALPPQQPQQEPEPPQAPPPLPRHYLLDSGASEHIGVSLVLPGASSSSTDGNGAAGSHRLPCGLRGPRPGEWLPPPAPWEAISASTPEERATLRWGFLAQAAEEFEERVLRARRVAAWVTRRRLRFAPDPFASEEEEEETEEVSSSVVPSPATWLRLEQALWVLARLIRLLVQVVRLLFHPTGSGVARLPDDE